MPCANPDASLMSLNCPGAHSHQTQAARAPDRNVSCEARPHVLLRFSSDAANSRIPTKALDIRRRGQSPPEPVTVTCHSVDAPATGTCHALRMSLLLGQAMRSAVAADGAAAIATSRTTRRSRGAAVLPSYSIRTTSSFDPSVMAHVRPLH